MKLPGPDHPITIAPNGNRVRVTFAGRVVADTTHALTLKEVSYKPVFYIPRTDADMSLLKTTDHRTHCPYKGDASYFTIHCRWPQCRECGLDLRTTVSRDGRNQRPFGVLSEPRGCD